MPKIKESPRRRLKQHGPKVGTDALAPQNKRIASKAIETERLDALLGVELQPKIKESPRRRLKHLSLEIRTLLGLEPKIKESPRRRLKRRAGARTDCHALPQNKRIASKAIETTWSRRLRRIVQAQNKRIASKAIETKTRLRSRARLLQAQNKRIASKAIETRIPRRCRTPEGTTQNKRIASKAIETQKQNDQPEGDQNTPKIKESPRRRLKLTQLEPRAGEQIDPK